MITISIIIYIFINFDNFNKRVVFSLELLVVFLMILDMIFYYNINKNQIGLINIIEFIIVGSFITLFFYIGFKRLR